jgi:hypothetical protein
MVIGFVYELWGRLMCRLGQCSWRYTTDVNGETTRECDAYCHRMQSLIRASNCSYWVPLQVWYLQDNGDGTMTHVDIAGVSPDERSRLGYDPIQAKQQ